MVTQVEADSLLVEWQYFMLQLSSFQTNQTVRKCILLFLLYILTGDFFTRSASGMTARLTTKSNNCFSSSARQWRKSDVFQTDRFGYSLSDLDFFPILSTK